MLTPFDYTVSLDFATCSRLLLLHCLLQIDKETILLRYNAVSDANQVLLHITAR